MQQNEGTLKIKKLFRERGVVRRTIIKNPFYVFLKQQDSMKTRIRYRD